LATPKAEGQGDLTEAEKARMSVVEAALKNEKK
jgi:hypothetical protein